MTRRDLFKRMAAAAAVSAAEALFPDILFAATPTPRGADGLEWTKTPCRFCGVGCGLLVGLAKGRAVAVKGDPASPVNKGLCCVKGYHSVTDLGRAHGDRGPLGPGCLRVHGAGQGCHAGRARPVAVAQARGVGMRGGFPTSFPTGRATVQAR
jgi:hypothetical protein